MNSYCPLSLIWASFPNNLQTLGNNQRNRILTR